MGDIRQVQESKGDAIYRKILEFQIGERESER